MWSDKYIGWKFKYNGTSKEEGTDCRTLVFKVLEDEFNYKIERKIDADIKWIQDNPNIMITEAVKHGDVIKDFNDLAVADLVFFEFNGEVSHMGIIIDKYKNYLHQAVTSKSCLGKITNPKIIKHFFCGIRIKGLKHKDD